MIVMKFGGASLKSGQSMIYLAEIVNKFKDQKVLVVVSAMYKITDQLISLFKKCKFGEIKKAEKEVKDLYKTHRQALIDLKLSPEEHKQVYGDLEKLVEKLYTHLFRGNKFLIADYDFIISFGERFSSILVTAALNKANIKAVQIDGSRVIVASSQFGNAKAFTAKTEKKAKELLLPLISQNIVPVVTGFFASNRKGEIVTLGRGGSDYSATIIAHALDAKEVILWKEVNGVFSSDPKLNPGAAFYSELSYKSALLLAEKGAKVLHPEAMKPVAAKGIIVRVKNTFNPDFSGTKIWKGGLV